MKKRIFFCIDTPAESAESTGCTVNDNEEFFHELLDEFLKAVQNGDVKAELHFEVCGSHICNPDPEDGNPGTPYWTGKKD